MASPVRQAASLVALVLNGDAGEGRTERAITVVQTADNLSFLAAFFAEMTRASNGHGSVPPVDRLTLGKAMAHQIHDTLKSASSFEAYSQELELLLSIWRDHAGADVVQRFLKERFDAEPGSLMELLTAFCRASDNREERIVADLDEERYRSVLSFVDATQVAASLERMFPADYDGMTLEQTYEEAGDARLAARFVVLHRTLNQPPEMPAAR